MRKFSSLDKFEIAGRGTVYTLFLSEAIPRKEVLYQDIEVDGTVYECVGIERFLNRLSDEELHKGESIGLLVRNKNV